MKITDYILLFIALLIIALIVIFFFGEALRKVIEPILIKIAKII